MKHSVLNKEINIKSIFLLTTFLKVHHHQRNMFVMCKSWTDQALSLLNLRGPVRTNLYSEIFFFVPVSLLRLPGIRLGARKSHMEKKKAIFFFQKIAEKCKGRKLEWLRVFEILFWLGGFKENALSMFCFPENFDSRGLWFVISTHKIF